MLRGTPSRRIATVLMAALVAMLLVPFAGSSRAAQSRPTAGPVLAKATTPPARTTHSTPEAYTHDLSHLDLTTPPADQVELPASLVHLPADVVTASAEGEVTVPTGRGPPAA